MLFDENDVGNYRPQAKNSDSNYSEKSFLTRKDHRAETAKAKTNSLFEETSDDDDEEDIFESGNDSRLKLSNLTVTQRRADIPTEKPRKDFRPLRKSVKADESDVRASTPPPIPNSTMAANQSDKSKNSRQEKAPHY